MFRIVTWPFRALAGVLWSLDIPLGRFAPYVLGISLGSFPHRVDNRDNLLGLKPPSRR